MGKRERIKRLFQASSHSSKDSPSKSASDTLGTVLELQLNEPSDRTSRPSLTRHRPQDAPVRDLWGLALERLSSEDKQAISPIMSSSKQSGSKLDILRHLHNVAAQKRAYCEDRRWKFELNGRQIILRDVAEKIIVWINKFKQIGDIAVNFDPVHASLPWAGMRFLLEVVLT